MSITLYNYVSNLPNIHALVVLENPFFWCVVSGDIFTSLVERSKNVIVGFSDFIFRVLLLKLGHFLLDFPDSFSMNTSII